MTVQGEEGFGLGLAEVGKVVVDLGMGDGYSIFNTVLPNDF